MREIINAAALDAVQEIASTMLCAPINLVSTRVDEVEDVADVSAVVGLSGGLKRSARLGSPMETVTALAGALIGEEINELNEDCEDAFGELAK